MPAHSPGKASLIAGRGRAPVREGCQNELRSRRVLIQHAAPLANSHANPRSVLDRTLKHRMGPAKTIACAKEAYQPSYRRASTFPPFRNCARRRPAGRWSLRGRCRLRWASPEHSPRIRLSGGAFLLVRTKAMRLDGRPATSVSPLSSTVTVAGKTAPNPRHHGT
jgi:hypothetical protein